MNGLESALIDLSEVLESAGIPYMVIGGLANLQWGRPRLTRDVDVTILAGEDRLPDLLNRLSAKFQPRVSDPIAFAATTRVIPLACPEGVTVDLVLAGLPFEENAIRRSVPVTIGHRAVRFCTAEDLILHKVLSNRLRDIEDVEGIVGRQGGNLDLNYILPRVGELSTLLDRPEILTRFREMLKAGGLET
jgi:hypothetical protein